MSSRSHKAILIMHSNQFDRWLTLVTSISVLISIILLLVEINQSNELVRVQIEQMRSNTYVTWQREVASGDHVARFFAKIATPDGDLSHFDLTQLDPVELVRFRAIAAARFYDYENTFAQHQRGFVSEEYWKQRIVPAIREWTPIWERLFGADGLVRRQDFPDEIDGIAKGQE